MTNDQTTVLADDPDRELDGVLHATVQPREATATLTRILLAFDARRRRQETLAIAEAALAAASRVARH